MLECPAWCVWICSDRVLRGPAAALLSLGRCLLLQREAWSAPVTVHGVSKGCRGCRSPQQPPQQTTSLLGACSSTDSSYVYGQGTMNFAIPFL